MTKNFKETENEVLEVYKRVNPSYRPIEENPELFAYMKQMRESLFFQRLKLPKKLFQKAKIVSFGSGTGEYELFYAMWGVSEITCVDINEISMNRLSNLFKHFDIENTLKRTHVHSYFDVDLEEEKYDFVIADGTIVHTEDPLGAIRKFINHIEDEGFIVISFGELAGGMQRNLQRFILYYLADNNETKIIEYASILFKEHLERSVKIGKRSKDAIIYDTYINPKIKTPMMQDVLKIFSENNIYFYSSYPFVSPFFLTSSFRENVTHLENESFYHLMMLNQICWLLASDDDKTVAEKDFSEHMSQFKVFKDFLLSFFDITHRNSNLSTFEQGLNCLKSLIETDIMKPLESFFKARLNELFTDLNELNELLRNRDVDLLKYKTFRRLFRGTCGVGNMYFVGQKHSNNVV